MEVRGHDPLGRQVGSRQPDHLPPWTRRGFGRAGKWEGFTLFSCTTPRTVFTALRCGFRRVCRGRWRRPRNQVASGLFLFGKHVDRAVFDELSTLPHPPSYSVHIVGANIRPPQASNTGCHILRLKPAPPECSSQDHTILPRLDRSRRGAERIALASSWLALRADGGGFKILHGPVDGRRQSIAVIFRQRGPIVARCVHEIAQQQIGRFQGGFGG